MIIVSAPSGAGKTTIVKRLLEADLGLRFSVSACSRPMRPKEVNGKDYYFMSVEEFKNKINDEAFLEWEEVYKDQYYGTLHSEIERIWALGQHVIFDVDVKGGLNIKKQYPENSMALFIQPPSVEVLEDRLRKRSTDNEESIRKRIGKAVYEMGFAGQFDHIIINEDLETAVEEAIQLSRKFLGS